MKLQPVRVAPECIRRTLVGLRPFRSSGFVVRAERLGEKLLVHNYGHGGAGVTLSWGTAEMAIALVEHARARRAAVLGAGAVGLASARLLQDRGFEVTLYAKAFPPETTSDVAGALWFPVTVADPERLTPAFASEMVRAARISHRRFQTLVGPAYGVRFLPTYFLSERPFPEDDLIGDRSCIRDLLGELCDLRAGEHPFPYAHVRRHLGMLIETPVYLQALLGELRRRGGRTVVRELRAREEVAALDEPVIVNCTGLGARALFGDEELVPIQGQLTVLEPQPGIDYATVAQETYMFPRRDGILLGGTHERGRWSLEPDLAARARILATHARDFAFPGR